MPMSGAPAHRQMSSGWRPEPIVALVGASILLGFAVLEVISTVGLAESFLGFLSSESRLQLFGRLFGCLLLLTTCSLLIVEGRMGASAGVAWMGIGSYLPAAAEFSALPAGLRAGVLAVAPASLVGTCLVLSTWGNQRVRGGPAAAATTLAAIAAAAHLLAYDPFLDPGCRFTCEPSTAAMTRSLGARAAYGVYAGLFIAAAVLTVRLVAPAVTVPPSIRQAAMVAVTLLSVGVAVPWLVWGRPNTGELDEWIRQIVAAVLALAVLRNLAHVWKMRRVIARMLEQTTSAGALENGGVTAVHFAIPEEDRWINHDGTDAMYQGSGALVLPGPDGQDVRLVLGSRVDPLR